MFEFEILKDPSLEGKTRLQAYQEKIAERHQQRSAKQTPWDRQSVEHHNPGLCDELLDKMW